jgi:hypothetical protein
MGISLFSSSSGDNFQYNGDNPKVVYINSTPDPSKWELINLEVFDNYFLLKVRYPDCTNYEGVKIMVYERNDGLNHIQSILRINEGALDPHFGVNPDFISPIARFEPTDRGWEMGIRFCKVMDI